MTNLEIRGGASLCDQRSGETGEDPEEKTPLG
jgi:hypothetical protein